jgi:hypothetical protein
MAAVNFFRVESAEPYGWIVYLDGFSKTHFFASRSLALMYAREWAKANAPSVIQVVALNGRVELDETHDARKLIEPPRSVAQRST